MCSRKNDDVFAIVETEWDDWHNCRAQLWTPPCKEEKEVLEQIQRSQWSWDRVWSLCLTGST